MFGNIQKVRFKSICPAHGCKNIEYWTHANCGGALYLDNRAMLTCDRGDAEDYIFNWSRVFILHFKFIKIKKSTFKFRLSSYTNFNAA